MAERKRIHVTITNVGAVLFEGEADSITLPGARGQMTARARHEPFITTLSPGVVTVRTGGGHEKEFSVTEGILEISNNHATVLV